ncbi:unnamed protein product [Cunninghamella blakesleeana]
MINNEVGETYTVHSRWYFAYQIQKSKNTKRRNGNRCIITNVPDYGLSICIDCDVVSSWVIQSFTLERKSVV